MTLGVLRKVHRPCSLITDHPAVASQYLKKRHSHAIATFSSISMSLELLNGASFKSLALSLFVLFVGSRVFKFAKDLKVSWDSSAVVRVAHDHDWMVTRQ